MTLALYQVDAFAETLFTGNPAAVVPLEHWLNDGLMQQIAAENNLSETAFFVKEKDDFHIRWFTPDYEIDLCGHATLASAYVVKTFLEPEAPLVRFQTKSAGTLLVHIADGLYTLDFPARPAAAAAIPKNLFESLNISTAVAVFRGRDYMVVLPDETAVRNVNPNFEVMKTLDAIGVIVTAKGKSAAVVSRCFYPGAGVPEDPVTGSAHCQIVPYWSSVLGKTKFVAQQLSPRGGTLQCELKGDRVLMGGNCLLYLKGEIYI